ncbi:MAG TPA: M56 family metallopeptidase [Pseudonocardia sp.]|uniref:M56 family metallopeptidase n=1 Tax=Pseudonocardia sp. TaxID=60912 RepID=UPI002BAF7087|nr:M56 family metallopeptidase [Pseudonocardia sp.]HTF45994.1 M56 family metallopeptidase [Pseudonocardia sp.]
MIPASVALLTLGVLLAEPVSRALAAARWPNRDPTGALLLWQAVGLAGGLALLGAGLTFGLAPLGDSLPAAVGTLADHAGRREWPSRLGLLQLLALAATLVLAARLLGVLGLATARTLRARRRHRDLLDVLATPWPAMAGARVLAHPLPVAYCLPGLRSRLVVSEGALSALSAGELAAVLAHERAHLRERHDLVVLPFVAWGATAPWVPGMARAQLAVAALVEMRADDVARASAGELALAGALRRVGGAIGASERATLTSFSAAVGGRLDRLEQCPDQPSRTVRAATRLTAVALVAVPTLALLLS